MEFVHPLAKSCNGFLQLIIPASREGGREGEREGGSYTLCMYIVVLKINIQRSALDISRYSKSYISYECIQNGL